LQIKKTEAKSTIFVPLWAVRILCSAVASRRFGCAFLSLRSSNTYRAKWKTDAKGKRRQATAL
jgi:hypothetical protein